VTGPTEKGESTRRAILDVATRVFAERGYRSARMEDIIDASGLSKGAIYFHFRSKLELARAVVVDSKEHWLAAAREEVDQHPTAPAQLHALGELFIRLSVADQTGWSSIRLAEQLSSELADHTRSKRKPARPAGSSGSVEDDLDALTAWVELVAMIITTGQSSGDYRPDLDATDTATVLVSAFDGLKTLSGTTVPDVTAFERRARQLLAMVERSLTP
jgi:AcrR family transcriptional regulator